MSQFDFDTPIDRHHTNAIKWSHANPDMLPMWIADMDFPVAPAIVGALDARLAHPVFGYQFDSPNLRHILVDRLARRHSITAQTDDIVFAPGLVVALNVVARVIGEAGTGVVTFTPIYPPFLTAPSAAGRPLITVPLASQQRDGVLDYRIDFDALERALIHADEKPRLFMLCNPHNPVGRAYTRAELEQLADVCQRHDLIVCSDEIHADLTLTGQPHISFASLSDDAAGRTITLMAPSKAFNIPGLGLGFAVVTNPDLRARLSAALQGGGAFVNALGFTAAEAAYTEGGAWLDALLAYLAGNRDTLIEFMHENMPEIPLTRPQATYLAWLDCRSAGIEGKAAKFFEEQANVWLSDGAPFGSVGEGFVRLNYGLPRAHLLEGLERMRAALRGGRR